MFWKIFLSNKFGFILATSLFSYWWTAKSLDNAPYTSLKETKLKPSYHENSPQKTNSRKFAAKQKQGKITTYELQYKTAPESKRRKQTSAVLFKIVRISSAFKQWFQTKLTKEVFFFLIVKSIKWTKNKLCKWYKTFLKNNLWSAKVAATTNIQVQNL